MAEQQNSILTLPGETQRGMDSMSSADQEFTRSIYELFAQFRDKSREPLDEIRLARLMRTLQDPNLDPIALPVPTPQLNTLNSTIDNMVADYMDNIPEAVMLPETPDNAPVASQMTDVLSWILYHAGFKKEWRKAVEDATTTGTGILQAFYDDEMDVAGKRGGVNVQSWSPESWLPDPYYENFQDGRAVFKVAVHPLSYFEQHYPEKAKYIAPDAETTLDYLQLGDLSSQHMHDDQLVCLLECWYRRYDAKKKRYAVHMAKVAGQVLLYDSRNDSPDGVFEHGMYPFVALRFRERKGTAYGTGMCYEFADTQRIINRYMRYIDENARASSKPKLLVTKGSVNVSDVADYEKQIIEVEGRVDKEGLNWFQASMMNSLIPTTMDRLQDMMKQDSGQNQFSRGEGGLGVTAASAIAQLQEAGGKLTRMHTSAYMDSFRDLCEQIVSLVGEFFTEPMLLMIHAPEGGNQPKQVQFDPAQVFQSKEPYTKPAMYVRVEVQKSNPNQIQAKNNLLMQIAQIAQATSPIPPVALVRAMSISGKEDIVKLLEETDRNAQIMQQLAIENEQLKAALQQTTQDALAKTQLIAAIGGQMRAGAEQAQASMPGQPAPQQPQQADYTQLTGA